MCEDNNRHHEHLGAAVQLARVSVLESGGRPFAALLTYEGEVIVSAVNTMLATGDPTAHAELEALRQAGREGQLGKDGKYVMYASGQPCPMCAAAMMMAGVASVYYAYANADAALFGLSTEPVYQELAKSPTEWQMTCTQLPVSFPDNLYELWRNIHEAK